jgi:hypothetical protein
MTRSAICFLLGLLTAGVLRSEEVLFREVISRECSLFVGQSPRTLPPLVEWLSVANGGFEEPGAGAAGLRWDKDQPWRGWTGGGNLGLGGPVLLGSGNSWGITSPPEGLQVVALQKDSTITNQTRLPIQGLYTISWQHASRAGQVNPYVLATNGIITSPTFSTARTEWELATFTVWIPAPAEYSISFIALNSGGGDDTVALDDVRISRYISARERPNPDFVEVISREVSVFVGQGPDREVVSREASVLVDVPGAPPPVAEFAVEVSPTGSTVSLDWSSYDPWKVRDVVYFRVYFSDSYFSALAGVPFVVVPGETRMHTFRGLREWTDHYFAVVPVDGLGQAHPDFNYGAAYVLMPEVISREATVFVGEGPNREVVSREASVVVDNPGPPDPVGEFSVEISPTGSTVTLDWTSYNQWIQRDVVRYRIYHSDRILERLEGVPFVDVPGETFRWTFTGLTEWTDHFFVIVPMDGLGQFSPDYRYGGAYVFMPEVVSRELTLFVGEGPNREVISREVSLVVPDATIPAPVTGIASGFIASTSRRQYGAVELDWSAYAEEDQKDLASYRVYVSRELFTDVTGMPWIPFPETPRVWDGRRHLVISNLQPATIYYAAVVGEDSQGKFNPLLSPLSVKSSIGSIGRVINLEHYPALDKTVLKWAVSTAGEDWDAFGASIEVSWGDDPIPVVLGKGMREWETPRDVPPAGTVVRVSLKDVFGNRSEPAEVLVKAMNTRPVLAGATNAILDEMVGYLQDLRPTDPDLPKQTLTVALLSGPAGLVVTNGILAWTPTERQGPSTNLVRVSVSDGIVSGTNTFALQVREVNRLPSLARATNASILEMVGYTQALAAVDPDVPAQPLTVTLLSGPAGLVVTNGVLAWMPTEAQGPSTNAVQVSVSDGVGSVTNSFSVVVLEVNTEPRWLVIPDGVGEVGKEYFQRIEAVDEDLPTQQLTLRLLEPVPGTVLDAGLFRWTPTSTQAGTTNRIRIVVSDGVASVENEFQIRVIGALTPPMFVGMPELAGDRLRIRVKIEGGLRLEVSDDLIAWRPYSTLGGSEGSVVTAEIPLELGYKFFRLVRGS